MGEHTTRYTQEALRQRYLALLVPALARINVDHPLGSGLQRVRAVRRAADTCLVAAASTTGDRFKPSLRLRLRRGRSSNNPRLVLIKRKLKIKSFANGSYIKSLRRSTNYKSPRSARLNLNYHNNNASASATAATTTTIPAESELKRLQNAIFPRGKGAEAGAINPATLLTQAARYILALQVQVDALNTLAQAADPAQASRR